MTDRTFTVTLSEEAMDAALLLYQATHVNQRMTYEEAVEADVWAQLAGQIVEIRKERQNEELFPTLGSCVGKLLSTEGSEECSLQPGSKDSEG